MMREETGGSLITKFSPVTLRYFFWPVLVILSNVHMAALESSHL